MKVSEILNSKPVIGVLIFIMLSLVSVWAGNVFVNEGNLGIENNLNITGNATINGNYLCNSTACFSLAELNSTNSGSSASYWGSNGSNIYNLTALIGIGTSSPIFPITILADTGKALAFKTAAGADNTLALYFNDQGYAGMGPNGDVHSLLISNGSSVTGYGIGLFYHPSVQRGGLYMYSENGSYINPLSIYAGKVGIGMSTNPISNLDVAGGTIHAGTASGSVSFNSIGNSANKDSATMNDSGDLYIEHDLEVDGVLTLTGGYAAIVNGDIAENMLTINGRNSLLCHADKTCIGTTYDHTELKYGDVVCVDTKYGQVIKKCDEANSQFAVGIVSNTSVINMGNNEKYSYPIAVAGIVFTKVSNENGNILPGDLLVSASKPGYAMKADKNPKGIVLGISFDFCDSKFRECIIPIFVALSHSDGLDISVLKDENSKMKQSLCSLGAKEWC